MNHKQELQKATFGGGCFWCVEAVFQKVKGVTLVVSGYSGGNNLSKPTYREVCSGTTGHAEVIQITYDTTIIDYKTLVEIFLTSHDPTTLNRQGNDVGPAYRSVIFYHSEEQQRIANDVIQELKSSFDDPIVTEVKPFEIFHEAEEYHQNYYRNNPTSGYCSFVITPKLVKLRKMHADKLKDLSLL